MDLDLTETQELIVRTARDYAERVIMPVAAEIDREERFPRDIVKGLADLGLMGSTSPLRTAAPRPGL